MLLLVAGIVVAVYMGSTRKSAPSRSTIRTTIRVNPDKPSGQSGQPSVSTR